MTPVFSFGKEDLKLDLDSIIQDMGEGYFDIVFDVLSENLDGRYIFVEHIPQGVSRWSREAVEYFGLPGIRLRDGARIWADHVIPSERDAYMDKIERLERQDTDTLSYITRVRNAEGEYKTTGCRARVIRSRTGEPLFFVGTIQNYEDIDTIDPVTGLYSRNSLIYAISQFLDRKERFIVAEAGIRNFFDFNSTYGFDEGNRMLKRVAEWLQSIKHTGAFFRGDGTKFVYVVKEEEHVTGEIRKAFAALKDHLKNDIYINGSHAELDICGGAMHVSDMTMDAATVYNNVQSALSKAKEENRMEMVVFDEEMQRASQARAHALNHIRKCVQDDCKGFFMVYQPIVNAEDESIAGMEALVRYRDENGRVIPPDEFIPTLEKDSVFYQLGLFIIRSALRDAKSIVEERPDYILNINLAYPQLQRNSFKNDLQKIMGDEGFDTRNLKLELTERCKLLDLDMLRNDITYFKGTGIQTALDDFGTGYSALGLLISLPVDQIKIDRSFIMGIEEDEQKQYLLEAITDCAANLSLKCCVEGVETEQMKDYLRKRFKVTHFQGYYYSRPLEIDDFRRWMMDFEADKG